MPDPNESAVTVLFPSEYRLTDWPERHARGEVPSRRPYGLDEVAAPGTEVSFADLPRPGLATRAAARIPLSWRRRVSPGGRQLGVTFDENAAYRMVTAAPRAEMYSGVIWLTDELTRRPASELAGMRRALQSVDGLWVLSRAQIAPLRDFLGDQAPPIDFLRFGIDETFFRPAPFPEKPMVLSLGNDRDRDPGTLFAAMERVHAAMPDVELMAQSHSDLPTPAGVTRLERMPHHELRELYRRATLLVVATRPNLHGSGMTAALEAMATGRPVVVSGTPGMDDYVRQGTTGILSGVGDGSVLADDVLSLLGDPARARAMGTAARADVEARFTTARMARELRGLLHLGDGADAPVG